MHRLLVTYPAPEDPNGFLKYYAEHHVPLARRLPGLLGCRWMQPKALGPEAPQHFVLFEADFESESAMFDALGSPTGAEVAADVPNYSPRGASLMHFDVTGS